MIIQEYKTNEDKKPRLLLHSCCGPCSSAVMERLAPRFDLTVFFFNPNITDREEYEKRKAAQLLCLEKYNEKAWGEDRIALLPDEYLPDRFYEAAGGLEAEPEGGARCRECFRLRLRETAAKAAELGWDYFTTTLSVSPHKNYPLIAALGEEIAREKGVSFWAEDFKKKAGYQRSIELSREYGLYRQNYCGCRFARQPQSP